MVIATISIPLAILFALTRPTPRTSRGKFQKVRGKKLPDLWAVPTMRKAQAATSVRSAVDDDDEGDDEYDDGEEDAEDEDEGSPDEEHGEAPEGEMNGAPSQETERFAEGSAKTPV